MGNLIKTSITFPINARRALELVAELKESGLIVNVDFEFLVHNEKINNGTRYTKYCEFRFREPKLATFYLLKWQTMTN